MVLFFTNTWVRLATTVLKDKESAQDNHVLACNFAKYSPILKYLLTHLAVNLFQLVINNPTTP